MPQHQNSAPATAAAKIGPNLLVLLLLISGLLLPPLYLYQERWSAVFLGGLGWPRVTAAPAKQCWGGVLVVGF